MNRETKVIKTPVDGVEIVIKTYITGREFEEIEDILYSGLSMSAIADKGSSAANVKFADGSFIKKQTHKAIELLINSVNGSSENVLDDILDLKKEDYLFVNGEIEKVTKDTGDLKKKEQ